MTEEIKILWRSIKIRYKVFKALGRKPSLGAPVLDLQLRISETKSWLDSITDRSTNKRL